MVLEDGETLIDAVVAPVDQRYVVAPDAVSVAVDPAHIPFGDDIFTEGFGFTVTETFVEPEQPPEVPVTV